MEHDRSAQFMPAMNAAALPGRQPPASIMKNGRAAMILIGQHDSSFVRRVGIALTLYGIDFEHRPWSTFGDADLIRPLNPLTRVPTLVLDDGVVLVDTHLILQYLDEMVGPDRALWPKDAKNRREAFAIAGLASGLADKTVGLFYELRLHKEASPVFTARWRQQIEATLDTLEKSRASRPGPWWFGGTMSHADIAVGASLRHLKDSHPDVTATKHPALAAHSAACEALEVFQSIQQVFIPPA
jgi:glutathione S-transferase